MKAVRIASFPTPTVNPYFGLYDDGLARFGVQVDYFRDITRAPLLTGPTGRLVDAVHFHWNLEKIWRSSGRSTLARLKGLAKWYRFLRRTKRAGVKILWTAHELAPPEGGTWSDRLGFLMCARAADLCISHSESSRQLVIRKFRLAADKTITIPHGNYDGVSFQPKHGRRPASSWVCRLIAASWSALATSGRGKGWKSRSTLCDCSTATSILSSRPAASIRN